MASLQDILKLIGEDDGKAFVMDETGDIKLVIMGTGEYQKLLLGKLKKQIEDVEEINQRIVEAQLHEAEAAKPVPPVKPQRVDMRSEVVDPDFDFDAEAITPDFEDI
jgi:hypothetical protein